MIFVVAASNISSSRAVGGGRLLGGRRVDGHPSEIRVMSPSVVVGGTPMGLYLWEVSDLVRYLIVVA